MSGPKTVQENLSLAIVYHQQGRLVDAETMYLRILAQEPDHPDALHLMGVVAHQTGRGELALERIGRAIEIDPKKAEYHSNLAQVLMAREDWDRAMMSLMVAAEIDPKLATVQHSLGNAYSKLGQPEAAIESYRNAIRLKPDDAVARNNLGSLLCRKGELDAALHEYRQALRYKPNYAEAYSNLGNTLSQKGELEEGIAALKRAIEMKPELAEAHFNLGTAYRSQGKLDEAIKAFQSALQLNPNSPDILNSLGNTVGDAGRLGSAAEILRAAIRIKPDYAPAYNNLAVVLSQQGNSADAVEACRQSLKFSPDHAETYGNLGNALLAEGQLDEAEEAFRESLRRKSTRAMGYNNLAGVLKEQGRLDEAIEAYRAGLRCEPGDVRCHSNMIYTLHFDPKSTPASLREEQKIWSDRHGPAMRAMQRAHGNDRAADRRLKIGYVSGDFCDHVVGRNFMPLIAGHDHEKFEIICYSNVMNTGAYSVKLHALADHWRNIVGMSDADAARTVRQDGIDILVDLSLYMAGNRLPIFAAKPAPIQATFMGYPGGTGLPEMDYRITDPYLDPPGEHDDLYLEKSARLKSCFWCYQGFVDEAGDPSPGELPARSNGHVTFGCMNNFCKVNDEVLELWSRVLCAVPGSRMLLITQPGRHREVLLEKMESFGVERGRMELVGRQRRADYLALHKQVDIMLDTFPYNGHTTHCDALWMAVPVVSLVGETAISRAGLSLLSNIGLAKLATGSREEYVKIAAALAGDLARLGILRATLRQRLKGSPIMDPAGFARSVEALYRDFWRGWIASGD